MDREWRSSVFRGLRRVGSLGDDLQQASLLGAKGATRTLDPSVMSAVCRGQVSDLFWADGRAAQCLKVIDVQERLPQISCARECIVGANQQTLRVLAQLPQRSIAQRTRCRSVKPDGLSAGGRGIR